MSNVSKSLSRLPNLICLLALGIVASCASSPRAAAETSVPKSTSTARFGSSLEAALAAQVANPQAAEGPSVASVTQGDRIVLAVDNYRKGTTKALVRESTSATKTGGGSE